MAESKGFYDRLTSFASFAEVTDRRHYSRVPDDWSVIITDVKGSTKAIAENRYKEVNMAGAATITAALNALGGRKTPFVFGGDGATFLLHDDDVAVVAAALSKTCAMVKKAYDLELRIGSVSIAHLTKADAVVEVAKFQVSKGSTLAMLHGGGVAVAEKWVKGGDARALAIAPMEGTADVNGLSCRWNPIPAKRGEMLSILVLAKGSSSELGTTYLEVLRKFEEILGTGDESDPVTESKLDKRVSTKAMAPELKLKAGDKGPMYAAKIFFGSVAIRLMNLFGLTLFGFDARRYVKDLVKNTDFRKFDDMLRMVRDCDSKQKREIETFLASMYREGRLYYGIHASKEALMTCMVFSTDDHIHFIDGSGGGYALAAKQLKGQMASLTSAS
ncbi:MAG: DUF3095 domain-containing protein [Bdellovibrionota bacterium]